MTTTTTPPIRRPALRAAVAVMAVLTALPAAALYKVVGPDGKVTYTDRPPAPASGRISPDDVIGRIFATFCIGK